MKMLYAYVFIARCGCESGDLNVLPCSFVDMFQLLPLWMTLPALKCELFHSLRSFLCVLKVVFWFYYGPEGLMD